MCARRVLRSGPSAEIARSPVPKRRDARQRALALDPMPDRVEPCLALLAPRPPTGEAAGKGPFHLAVADGGRGRHLGGAAGLYARRHRLAKPSAHMATKQRRLRSGRFIFTASGRDS